MELWEKTASSVIENVLDCPERIIQDLSRSHKEGRKISKINSEPVPDPKE